MSTLEIRPAAFVDPDVRELVAQVQAEYVVLYGGPDDTPLEDGVFDAPRGAFFVGSVLGQPVAMGGWRTRPDVHALGGVVAAEVKRMYVAPAVRGNGYARQVLAHLEGSARAAGADVMVLETGTAQPAAIALYESSGYEPVHAFGHYAWSPKSRYYGKRL